MLRFFNPNTQKQQEVPAAKLKLVFFDPEDRSRLEVPVMQIVVGGLDYEMINKYPYVYDRVNGYISIQGKDGIAMQRLDKTQIDIIEQALKIKADAHRADDAQAQSALTAPK